MPSCHSSLFPTMASLSLRPHCVCAHHKSKTGRVHHSALGSTFSSTRLCPRLLLRLLLLRHRRRRPLLCLVFMFWAGRATCLRPIIDEAFCGGGRGEGAGREAEGVREEGAGERDGETSCEHALASLCPSPPSFFVFYAGKNVLFLEMQTSLIF